MPRVGGIGRRSQLIIIIITFTGDAGSYCDNVDNDVDDRVNRGRRGGGIEKIFLGWAITS